MSDSDSHCMSYSVWCPSSEKKAWCARHLWRCLGSLRSAGRPMTRSSSTHPLISLISKQEASPSGDYQYYQYYKIDNLTPRTTLVVISQRYGQRDPRTTEQAIFSCLVCDCDIKGVTALRSHIKGTKHLRREFQKRKVRDVSPPKKRVNVGIFPK